MEYAAAFAIVFGINLLPAFAPPTWAVLAFVKINWDLDTLPLVVGGALAAASGRFVLANAARHFRGRMSAERLENLAVAEEALTRTRGREYTGMGLFALSPIPSAQLFIAAGLLTVPLLPLTAAFLCGRLVSYTVYVTAADVAADSLGDVLTKITSPLGIALQIVMLGLIVALYRVNWARVLTRGR